MAGAFLAAMIGCAVSAWSSIVTTGGVVSLPNLSFGYSSSTTMGSISNNVFLTGDTVNALCSTSSDSGATYSTYLQLAGGTLPPNSGWDWIDVDGTKLYRSAATYSNPSGTIARWLWAGTGNLFGAGGSSIPVSAG